MKVAQVTNSPNLVRDITNKAILNTDNEGLAAYKAKKKKAKELEDRMNLLENKLDIIIQLLDKK